MSRDTCYLAECRTCGAFTGAVMQVDGLDAERTAVRWMARGDKVRVGHAQEFRDGPVCHGRSCENGKDDA